MAYQFSDLNFNIPNYLGEATFLRFGNPYALQITRFQDETNQTKYEIYFMKMVELNAWSPEVDELLSTITIEPRIVVDTQEEVLNYVNSVASL